MFYIFFNIVSANSSLSSTDQKKVYESVELNSDVGRKEKVNFYCEKRQKLLHCICKGWMLNTTCIYVFDLYTYKHIHTLYMLAYKATIFLFTLNSPVIKGQT